MTEQERAAALADKISECGIIEVWTEMERIVIRALRLLAATPAASSEVRGRVAGVIRAAIERWSTKFDEWDSLARDDPTYRDRVTLAASRIAGAREIATDIDAALSGDRLPAWVMAPEEPTEAMRLAFQAQPGNWFDKMRAALAVAAAGGVPPVGFVRHEKRGSVYAVLGEATAQVSKPTHDVFTDRAHRLLRDYDRLVVYVGADGRLWVRFPDEMEDGRFAPVEPGDMPKVGDQAPAAASLIASARSVIAANRSYLENNPFAAKNPDALTEAIARLESEVSAAGERDAR